MKRKLHHTGGYSYFVCLPPEWLKKNIKGHFVEVVEKGDMLVIKAIG